MIHNRSFKVLAMILASVILIVSVAGCAAGDDRWDPGFTSEEAGFWAGLWHGFISLVTFIISLFNKNVGIYEANNKGGWYNFGFIVGIMLFWSGGAGASARSSKRRCRSED